MSKANKIYKVLVPSGGQDLATAGSPISALLPNQIGVYSFQDGVAIDGSTAPGKRDFFLAVGRDTDGDGVINKIDISSGTHIQASRVQNYSLRCYTPGQPKIIDITDFTADCDKDYCLRVSVLNSDTMAMFGPNDPFKSYVVHTGCCEGCDTCPDGDCVELAKKMVDAVNTDPDKLFSASLIDYTTTPGTPIVVANDPIAIAAFVAANPDKCLGVRLTGNNSAINHFCCVNLKYSKLVAASINAYLGCGFECNGKVSTFQEMVYEETSANDLLQDEYFAGGFYGNPGVYRASTLNGVVTGAETNIDPKEKYLVIDLEYDLQSESGWGEYLNDNAVRIAIPCADIVSTAVPLLTVLDTILSNQFSPLTDNAGACPACTVVNKTTDKGLAIDGLA